jgi:hypothetical protein
MENLKVGEHSVNVYWAVRGDSGVKEEHLSKFRDCGVRAKAYKGHVWIVENLKFLRPFDTVKPEHKTLLSYYTGYKLNEKPVENHTPLPFNTFTIVDYRAMVAVGGDGPFSHMWSEWKNNVLCVHDGDKVNTYLPYNLSACNDGNFKNIKAKA